MAAAGYLKKVVVPILHKSRSESLKFAFSGTSTLTNEAGHQLRLVANSQILAQCNSCHILACNTLMEDNWNTSLYLWQPAPSLMSIVAPPSPCEQESYNCCGCYLDVLSNGGHQIVPLQAISLSLQTTQG